MSFGATTYSRMMVDFFNKKTNPNKNSMITYKMQQEAKQA